jgi:hypothetical protein
MTKLGTTQYFVVTKELDPETLDELCHLNAQAPGTIGRSIDMTQALKASETVKGRDCRTV